MSNGLKRTSTALARRASSTSSSLVKAVIMITVRWGATVRMVFSASTPLTPGIWMSMSATS